MRENEPVLLVLSVCDGKIILEKGEILYEKCQSSVCSPGVFPTENLPTLGGRCAKIALLRSNFCTFWDETSLAHFW